MEENGSKGKYVGQITTIIVLEIIMLLFKLVEPLSWTRQIVPANWVEFANSMQYAAIELALIIILCGHFIFKKSFKDMGLSHLKENIGTFIANGLFLGAYVVAIYFAAQLSRVLEFDGLNIILTIITNIVAVAFIGELIFRGILMDAFENMFSKKGIVSGLVASVLVSILFTATYIPEIIMQLTNVSGVSFMTALIGPFLLGLYLCIIYHFNRNIWVCIAMHGVFLSLSDLNADFFTTIFKWAYVAIMAIYLVVTVIRYYKSEDDFDDEIENEVNEVTEETVPEEKEEKVADEIKESASVEKVDIPYFEEKTDEVSSQVKNDLEDFTSSKVNTSLKMLEEEQDRETEALLNQLKAHEDATSTIASKERRTQILSEESLEETIMMPAIEDDLEKTTMIPVVEDDLEKTTIMPAVEDDLEKTTMMPAVKDDLEETAVMPAVEDVCVQSKDENTVAEDELLNQMQITESKEDIYQDLADTGKVIQFATRNKKMQPEVQSLQPKMNNEEMPRMKVKAEPNYINHLEKYLGEFDCIFRQMTPTDPPIDIMFFKGKRYNALVTNGMRGIPMKLPPELGNYKFVELMMFLDKSIEINDSNIENEENAWLIKLLIDLALFPKETNSYLNVGHIVGNGDKLEPYSSQSEYCGALIFPPIEQENVNFQRYFEKGNTIHLYNVMPLFKDELRFIQEHSSDQFINLMSEIGVRQIIKRNRIDVIQAMKQN